MTTHTLRPQKRVTGLYAVTAGDIFVAVVDPDGVPVFGRVMDPEYNITPVFETDSDTGERFQVPGNCHITCLSHIYKPWPGAETIAEELLAYYKPAPKQRNGQLPDITDVLKHTKPDNIALVAITDWSPFSLGQVRIVGNVELNESDWLAQYSLWDRPHGNRDFKRNLYTGDAIPPAQGNLTQLFPNFFAEQICRLATGQPLTVGENARSRHQADIIGG